jgi:hypothetical protein
MTAHASLKPRRWAWQQHGRTISAYIRPTDHHCTAPAAELADGWLACAPELPGSHEAVRQGVLSLLRFFDHAMERPSSLRYLTRGHLDAWELSLLARQLQDRKDRHYRHVVHLFALLRRMDDDRPGLLAEEVRERVLREPRLSHLRPQVAEEPFTTDELAALVTVAGGIVKEALDEHREQPGAFRGPTVRQMVALHVLLSAATGEPPEVLRRLTIHDVTATYRRAGNGKDRLHAVAVRYTKTRSGNSYTVAYTSRHPDARAAYEAVLELTASARAAGDFDTLWAMTGPGDEARHCNRDGRFGLRHLLRTVEGLDLSEPQVYRRIRKTVTTAEALEDPARYFRVGRRHTPQTFLQHYATSPVLRAEAGRVLVEAISTKFEAALRGPTVLTSAAEDLVTDGQPAPDLDPETARRASTGELDTPLAACRDITHSPHAPPGQPCPAFAAGFPWKRGHFDLS